MIGRVAVITALVACGGGSSSAPPPTEPAANTAPTPLPDAGPDDTELRDKMVDFCDRSMQIMGENPDDLQTAMSNVMLSCSTACDLGSKPSCDHLDDFMTTTCGAVISICDGLCSKDVKSPSLHDAACAHDSTP